MNTDPARLAGGLSPREGGTAAPAAWYTYVQLAAVLGRSVETVRSLVRRGELPPPVRLSKRTLLFDAEAVHAALRRRHAP
jgi:excisionase family DNA binding protein